MKKFSENETKVLRFLKRGSLNFWSLTKEIEYFPHYVKAIKRLKKLNLIKIKKSLITLTEKGKEFVKKENLKSLKLKKEKREKIDRKFLEKYKKLRKRIFPKTELDQAQLTEESIVKKITLMKEKNDLSEKKIICLGDDDFFAIALALTKMPAEIAILDIDKEILNYEEKILKKLGFSPICIFQNIVKELPKKLKGRFDLFVCEPPDTLDGLVLFFSRGIEALKNKGGVGYIGVSKNDFEISNYLKFQKNILKANCLITDIYPQFEKYLTVGDEFSWIFGLPDEIELPQKPWFYADLLRIKTFPNSRPLFKGNYPLSFSKKILKTNIYC